MPSSLTCREYTRYLHWIQRSMASCTATLHSPTPRSSLICEAFTRSAGLTSSEAIVIVYDRWGCKRHYDRMFSCTGSASLGALHSKERSETKTAAASRKSSPSSFFRLAKGVRSYKKTLLQRRHRAKAFKNVKLASAAINKIAKHFKAVKLTALSSLPLQMPSRGDYTVLHVLESLTSPELMPTIAEEESLYYLQMLVFLGVASESNPSSVFLSYFTVILPSCDVGKQFNKLFSSASISFLLSSFNAYQVPVFLNFTNY